jgi:CDP-6-deoxy-D-xylo-4-hexulose-3-dehydrase
LDSSSRTGEIVLLDFPYTNARGSKVRPAVILYDNAETGTGTDLTVAYLTTEVDNYAFSPSAVLLEQKDLISGRLKKTSIIRTDKVITVDSSRFTRSNVAKLHPDKIREVLKSSAGSLVSTYYRSVHQAAMSAPFTPGISRVNYAGRVFDAAEMHNLVDASLDFWLTSGPYSKKFETDLADRLGVKHALLVNSGSSANLLAFMCLTSPKLGDRAIRRGDEVITVAAGFPTTIAPVVQYGAVPVFVDVDPATANIDPDQLEEAHSSRTRAVMLAHTLGNPFNIRRVKQFCQKHGLWLIEDNCDALGSLYLKESAWPEAGQEMETGQLSEITRPTGTFGHIGTSSFYPPHHLTMGEGGAVYTNDTTLYRILLSMRDWGRDCWCPSGKDNTCGKRFAQQHGSLPYGFDHKYVYSHFGYNLKPTDMQAAIGCAQLEKLDDFTARRRANFDALCKGLQDLSRFFILPQPEPGSLPSWFGFLLTIKDNVPFARADIVNFLEERKIQTRNLFAGNITRHPCFESLKLNKDYKVVGSLEHTDKIMHDSFWLGVYPGMGEQALTYMIDSIQEFAASHA